MMPRIEFKIIFLLASINVIGQNDLDYKTLDVNNVRTSLNADGSLFFNDSGPGSFQVPYTGDDSGPSVMNAGNLIVIGRDDAGNIKSSIGMYETDFQPGFLDDNGQLHSSDKMKQNRVWSVTKSQIEEHRQRIADCDTSYEIPRDILEWPALGNNFYEQHYLLPSAPFYDNNGNAFYEPHLGDFPIVGLDRSNYIPDQLLLSVSSDTQSPSFGGGEPINLTVLTMLYAYQSDVVESLNNSVFQRHILVNRGSSDLHETRIGLWYDSAFGCPEDDRIGCDTLQQAMYVYNGDDIDGDEGNMCSSEEIESYPSSSVLVTKFLSNVFFDLGSVIGWGESGEALPQSNQVNFSASGIYQLLKGKWSDGTHITQVNGGYNPNQADLEETTFLFHDNPSEEGAWVSPSDDYQMLMNTSLFQLRQGASFQIEVIHTFTSSDSLDHIEIVGQGLSDAEEAQQYIFANEHNSHTAPIMINKVIIYPNPSASTLSIESPYDIYHVDILDVDRKLVGSYDYQEEYDISDLIPGVYLVMVRTEEGMIIWRVYKN